MFIGLQTLPFSSALSSEPYLLLFIHTLCNSHSSGEDCGIQGAMLMQVLCEYLSVRQPQSFIEKVIF